MANPRTRLEQLATDAHLSVPDFCDGFHRAATAINESGHVSISQAKRWLGGTGTAPRAAACRVLESWWHEPTATLLGPPVSRGAVTTVNTEELLMSAGRESTEDALNAAAAIEPAALESLHAEAARLSRNYYTAAPLALLTELVRLRNAARVQLARTHKPRQRAELYLIAGEVCGLMSSVAFDLGHPDSSEDLARAAYTYGNVIDHPSLCTWARALTMTVLLWAGRYREITTIATGALEQAPVGTARARIYGVRARALAHLGSVDETVADLSRSADELDRAGGDELMDATGGEMGFDRTRRALCAGSAYVALRDGDHAQDEAADAVDLFTAQPSGRHWQAGELAARADLATGRMFSGDIAGAEEALGPVFALAPEHRTEALTARLHTMRRLAGTAPFRGAAEAARVSDAIEHFTTRALPQTTATLELPTARELSTE